MKRRRVRQLDAQETALWHHVVRSVTPLRPEDSPLTRTAPAPETTLPAVIESPSSPPVRPSDPRPPSPERAEPQRPALAALDPRLKRRLSRGAPVDARLDLHGLTQSAAHRRLILFLMEAHATGFSLVLVITGKGASEERSLAGAPHRGILRRIVPLWLAEPGFRPYVVGFETASRRHGGEGALYVRVRRGRTMPGRDPT